MDEFKDELIISIDQFKDIETELISMKSKAIINYFVFNR